MLIEFEMAICVEYLHTSVWCKWHDEDNNNIKMMTCWPWTVSQFLFSIWITTAYNIRIIKSCQPWDSKHCLHQEMIRLFTLGWHFYNIYLKQKCLQLSVALPLLFMMTYFYHVSAWTRAFNFTLGDRTDYRAFFHCWMERWLTAVNPLTCSHQSFCFIDDFAQLELAVRAEQCLWKIMLTNSDWCNCYAG